MRYARSCALTSVLFMFKRRTCGDSGSFNTPRPQLGEFARINKNSRGLCRGLIVLPLVFLLTPPGTHSQGRASVAQANLNYLVENARTIVRGNVLSTSLEPHPQFSNLQTVVVTIAVAKSFKGQVGSTLTFRQYVWETKEFPNAGGYHKAEELLLFLNPESAYGLTSPVGMEQGHFRVLHDNKGNRYAVNGRGNVGLFSDVLSKSAAHGVTFSAQAKAMLSKAGGQVALSTLEETIQGLVGSQR